MSSAATGEKLVMELSLLSYNLYAGDDYKQVRIPYLVREILAKDPDVLCLQECTQAVADALMDSSSGRYWVAWTKTTAMEEKYREDIVHDESATSNSGSGNTALLHNVGDKLGWKKPNDLAGLGSGRCEDALELSELFVIVNVEKFDVVDREMVHIGNWFDDGMLRLRLQLKSFSPSDGGNSLSPAWLPVIEVFNIHFCGGSFGKPQEVVLKKREKRKDELNMLNEAVLKALSGPKGGTVTSAEGPLELLVIAGDFNCDPGLPEMFPECSHSPEVALSERSFFIDAGKDLGPTESTSRNLFRKWLKPGQEREARFDRILLCSGKRKAGASVDSETTPTLLNAELIGDQQVATERGSNGEDVPLFPSDHFGVFAKVRIERPVHLENIC